MEYVIDSAQLREYAPVLRAGDRVVLSGRVYTARDAAHKRIVQALENGEPLPFDLNNAAIYYAGPTPAPQGLAVGACGPTTSGRMDVFAPLLLDNGLAAMIGKGERNKAVCDSIIKNKAVYLCAIGGAGALASKCIKSCRVIAYDDLGTEAIRRLTVKDFPVIVVIDSEGNNLYETAVKEYRDTQGDMA